MGHTTDLQEKIKPYLADPNEQLVGVVGNTLLETFLANGMLGNGFAFLTNRRVYFKGMAYQRTEKGFYKSSEEQVVNVDNVTGTRFVHRNPTWIKVLYIFCWVYAGLFALMGFGLSREDYLTEKGLVNTISIVVVLCLAGLFLRMWYVAKSVTLFEIAFAGGGIAFGLSWIDMEEAEAFQKLIQTTKDAAIKRDVEERRAVVPSQKPIFSSADELMKYKQLLDAGAITPEEFESFKQKLM